LRLLDNFIKNRIDSTIPRKEGLTFTIDKLASLNKDDFSIVAPFIDQIKISGALALLTSEQIIQKKINFYHEFDIRVSIAGTISELAVLKKSFSTFLGEVTKLGFDVIEIGENSMDLDLEQKKKIISQIQSKELDYILKVGKRDPRHQLGVEETLAKVDEALSLGSSKILLEANQGISVGIYDENSLIKWNFVSALTSKYPPSTFIFEAPLESQQSALIAEFGERVNIAEVDMDSVIPIESQRRGFLAKSSFGVSYLRKDPEGGPAVKFVYYIIKIKNPIDQAEIISMSHMPRRTVQSAIDELKSQGLIIERTSLDDARKKVYHPVSSDWL
jgi:phosphosulfolactate synthase